MQYSVNGEEIGLYLIVISNDDLKKKKNNYFSVKKIKITLIIKNI